MRGGQDKMATQYQTVRKLIGPLVSTKKLRIERLIYESMRIEALNFWTGFTAHKAISEEAGNESYLARLDSRLTDAIFFLREDASKVNYELAKRMGLSEERIIELERQANEDALSRTRGLA